MDTGTGLAEHVLALWSAFDERGVDAMLELVPDDVEWRPYMAGGATMKTTDGLREYVESVRASGERQRADIEHVEELDGGLVLVVGAFERSRGPVTLREDMAWLYGFEAGRLRWAQGFPGESEARSAAAELTGRQPGRLRLLAPFEMQVRAGISRTTIIARGELDLVAAPRLRDQVLALAAPDITIRIDLSGVTFLDSSGLGTILGLLSDADRDGWRLRIASPSPPVQRVMTIAGLDGHIPTD